MVKDQITVTIDREILKRVEQLLNEEYPGASRSFGIELLVRRGLAYKGDISVVKV